MWVNPSQVLVSFKRFNRMHMNKELDISIMNLILAENLNEYLITTYFKVTIIKFS